MYQTRHFLTGNFRSYSTFLSDEDYSKALDNVVKATCDIFLVRPLSTATIKSRSSEENAPTKTTSHQSDDDEAMTVDDCEVLLGDRVGYPHPDWWIPGGRVMPGETCEHTAIRVLRRELHLDIAPGTLPCGRDHCAVTPTGAKVRSPEACEVRPVTDRVRTVAHYTFVWDTRTQQPRERGTCDVSIILRVDVTPEEAASISLIHQEYRELKWVRLSELRKRPPGDLHPALMQGAAELAAMRQWDALQGMLKQTTPTQEEEVEETGLRGNKKSRDATIVEMLRKYSAMRGEL